MNKNGDVVWVRCPRDIFWPSKIVDDEDEEDKKIQLIYFFDENSWERVSSKLKICCWGCEKHDSYVAKGESLENINRKLSFNRALASALQEYKGTPKRGRKKKTQKKQQGQKQKSVTSNTSNSDTEKEAESGQIRMNSPTGILNNNGNIADNYDDEDDDDLPEAFSPVRKSAETFLQGDLVWAKFKTYPFWPGVFHSLSEKGKRNKKAKAWVFFMDQTWSVQNYKRTILPVPVEKVVPYYCDPWMREQMMKEGKESKNKCEFEKCVKYAEEYAEIKASGKLQNFFEYQVTESEDDEFCEDNNETNNNKQKQNIFKRGPLHFKDLVSSHSRSKRETTSKQKYKKLLDAFERTRPILVKIFKEEIPCQRHEVFMRGSTKSRNTLKYQSGFGPIADEKITDDILDKLRTWFEDCKESTTINSVTYVSEVWLPEAMILALMQSEGVDRKKAELMYHNGE